MKALRFALVALGLLVGAAATPALASAGSDAIAGKLPTGVTLATASTQQLADAVAALVRAGDANAVAAMSAAAGANEAGAADILKAALKATSDSALRKSLSAAAYNAVGSSYKAGIKTAAASVDPTLGTYLASLDGSFQNNTSTGNFDGTSNSKSGSGSGGSETTTQ